MITATIAGIAVVTSIATNALSGEWSIEGASNILNFFQLLIVVALIEVSYPSKAEAFLQGFSISLLTAP